MRIGNSRQNKPRAPPVLKNLAVAFVKAFRREHLVVQLATRSPSHVPIWITSGLQTIRE